MSSEPVAPLSVEARLDGAAPVRIGDVVTVEVVASGDGAATARLVVPRDLGSFEAVGEPERVERAVSGESVEARFVVRLQPFATGRLTVPAFSVETDSSTGSERAESRSLPLDVAALTVASTEPALAKLVLPPVGDAALVPATLVVAVVAIAFARAWRSAGRTRSTPLTAEAGVATSEALDALDALVAVTGDEADLPAAYDRLAQLVVRYVSRTYAMTSRARTTSEIVRAVGARHGAARAGEVAGLLGPCDAARFSGGERDLAAFRRHAAAVRDFIRSREAS